MIEGRFGDVDVLAAEPDAPAIRRVLKARADAARGMYAEAEAALAAEAERDPAGEAALELGLLLRSLGRPDEAQARFEAVLSAASSSRATRDPEVLLRLGRALAADGRPRQANTVFQEASRLAPNDPRIPTAWGNLFIEKHNTKEAAELFGMALKADDRWVPAAIGLARALMEDDPVAARESLDRALAIDPDSVDARLLLAELALDERRIPDAVAEIDRALAVNPRRVEALALRAAVAFLQDRPEETERLAAEALAINPRAGEVYRVVGAQAASHYRFEDAVALLQKGAALDPDNPRIQAELGMHLLRTGDEAAARAALEKSFKLDRYDVVTYNLLSMLDNLDRFETFEEQDLIVKLHPDEVRIMREPVVNLAREALAILGKRYGVTPRGPVLIEMFPKHDDFAVRTLGLPGMVGALGACFGRVVTLDSPRASRTPGTFNWSATLWHEMAHVVTLQLSAQRVPRWLTEGTSVFEERRANPSWGREGEHDFLRAYARGDLIPLATLNTGFSSARTIGLAYHQSSVVVEYLVERFGDAGLQKLLKAFATGQSQEEALQSALGLTFAELQTSFDAFLESRYGGLKKALAPLDAQLPEGEGPEAVAALVAFADEHAGNYDAQLAAGRALMERGAKAEARRVLERAATLVPQTMGDESPRMALAELALEADDKARAMSELERVIKEAHTGMDAARQLLAVARETGDNARAQLAAERIVALDPFDGAAHAELGRLALQRQEPAAAIESLELALSLNPTDPVVIHTDLAEAFLASGQPEQVKQHVIAALEIAPRFERAQELLLRIVDGR